MTQEITLTLNAAQAEYAIGRAYALRNSDSIAHEIYSLITAELKVPFQVGDRITAGGVQHDPSRVVVLAENSYGKFSYMIDDDDYHYHTHRTSCDDWRLV